MNARTIVVTAALFGTAAFSLPTHGQGYREHQRRRDASCTQPSSAIQQSVQPATPTFRGRNAGPGAGFGYRWRVSSNQSKPCAVNCWRQTTIAPPTTEPAGVAQEPSIRWSPSAPRAGWRAGRGGPPEPMNTIHSLLSNNAQIRRTVEDIDGGVLTLTTSDNPAVAALIKTHVTQMKDAMIEGRPIRQWDPLFVALFAARGKIRIDVEPLADGVKVREVSSDEHVVGLIRQHAHRGVSEFVAAGWSRVHQPTPLPDKAEKAVGAGIGD